METIVSQTAGSTEANSVCISEGSFQNMLKYNKQKLQGVVPWGEDRWIGNQIWLPT